MKTCKHARDGFTLIELLVVISLMAILATLAITFMPNAASAERERRAGTQLQSWLTIAKQRALRDQAPRGLRLWVNPAAVVGATPIPNAVTDCQYLEQPDDFPGNSSGSTIQVTAAALGTVNINVDLTNGSPANQALWTVQLGDFLEVQGTGLMHQISGVTPTQFNIVPPLPFPIAATINYRIIRSPRTVGDETLKLPEGTVIDVGTNLVNNNPLPLLSTVDQTATASTVGNFYDIMFSPSGQVISRGVTTDKIHLWVRAPNQDNVSNVYAGDPALISIFVRSGFVGAYPVARSPASPYALVQ